MNYVNWAMRKVVSRIFHIGKLVAFVFNKKIHRLNSSTQSFIFWAVLMFVEFLCNHPVEQKGGDATKEKAITKDETDVGEVEGENVSDCDESKNAADGNVANH